MPTMEDPDLIVLMVFLGRWLPTPHKRWERAGNLKGSVAILE